MIDISDALEGILNGYSYRIHYRLQSWLNEEVIAEDIPADEVLEEGDLSLRVPERLTFRVPIEVDGVSWVPTSADHPLAVYGQRILAQIGVSVETGAVEWLNRGIFLINSAETDGSAVSVECLGLLQLLDEAELATEYQPATGATLQTALRQLIEPGITVDFDEAPADRTIKPSAVTWSDNRLDDVYTILDAWPAQGRITHEGHLEVTEVPEEPESGDEVFVFTDSEGGTVVEYAASLSREGAFNAVIAEGQYGDDRGSLAGLPIIQTAVDVEVDSPLSLIGNFSPYLVPHKFQSPLLNEHVETLLAARSKLRELRQRSSRTVEISCVPHPALMLGDAVAVISSRLNLAGVLGRVSSFQLPYSPTGGAMTLTVALGSNSIPLPAPIYTPASVLTDLYVDTYSDVY